MQAAFNLEAMDATKQRLVEATKKFSDMAKEQNAGAAELTSRCKQLSADLGAAREELQVRPLKCGLHDYSLVLSDALLLPIVFPVI